MEYMKQPCKRCPFRNDITPYLHPDRASEIAYTALNIYSNFTCHATIEYDGDEDEWGRSTGDFSRAKTCAGLLTLRAQLGEDIPDGFEPAWDICYIDEINMIQAYEDEWERTH